MQLMGQIIKVAAYLKEKTVSQAGSSNQIERGIDRMDFTYFQNIPC